MSEHGPAESTARDRVAELRRWEDSGAHWRVLHRTGRAVTGGLFSCDGGTEVDRFTSDDAALLSYIGGRHSSAD